MFQFFVSLFSGRRTLRAQAPHLSAIAHHNLSTHQSPPQEGQWYEQSPYVYVAINRIAEACALVPLRLYRQTAQGRRELTTHPLLDLLQNPNPITSRFELLEQTIGMLELAGNAYWFIAGDERGLPREIWNLRPDRMTVVPDSEQVVRGYLYELDGKRIPLEAVEVIHFKRWHPASDYYGLSALSAARMAIQSDRAMAQWNANTFGRDHAVPAGIVTLKSDVTERDFERIKHDWRTLFGTGQRRTAFLRGGDMTWTNIGLNHTDLDFLQGRKANRDEILNIFGVPIGLMSENATEANAKVAERSFIERTLYPKLVRVAERLTQELCAFYDDALLLTFEDIRPTDTQTRLEDIRTAQFALSINEIRARYYDLPPMPWGDLPLELSPARRETAVTTPPLPHAHKPLEEDAMKMHFAPTYMPEPQIPSNEWDTELDMVIDEWERVSDEP